MPIFRSTNTEATRQVASGVLLRLDDRLIIMTAAHVIDQMKESILHLPTESRIEPIDGQGNCDELPYGLCRAHDMVDIGYIELASTQAARLHPLLKPAGVNDLLLSGDLEDGDLFTFVGYPWRKSRAFGGESRTEQVTYTGHLLHRDRYNELGFDRNIQIAVGMRLKKTYSSRYASHKIAPHPQGISGGLVLAWPRGLKARTHQPVLKIAGIAHSYIRRSDCLVATRVTSVFSQIVGKNPQER
jgi:hypothetical protein